MNSVELLLHKLAERNIWISLDGMDLKIKFDGIALPGDIISEIKSNKNELVRYLKNIEQVNRLSEIKPVVKQADYSLSSSQLRLWVLSQFSEASAAYNIPGAYLLEGKLNRTAFNDAFSHLIKRHEILRTVFKENNKGEIRQFVKQPNEIAFSINYIDLREENHKGADFKLWVEQDFKKPFNLSMGPLLRVSVLQTEDNKWIFSYVMHHIISDGWSMTVLIKDLFELYNAFADKKNPALNALEIQYKDYTAWQQGQLKENLLADQRNYWLQQLSGNLPVLEIKTDFVRPTIKTYEGAVIKKIINKAQVSQIKDFCSSEGLTLYMALVASVKVLLFRYTGEEDAIIGSPIAGREYGALENQVGPYLNMLALRTKVQGEDNFKEVSKKVKQVTLNAYQNQAYPFDALVNDLALKMDMSRNPLFDIMVVLQNENIEDIISNSSLVDLTVSKFKDVQAVVSKFDITFDFCEADESLELSLEYNSDLFESKTIDRLGDHLIQLLKIAIDSAEEPINQLDYLTGKEKQQLLEDFNNTKVGYPEKETFLDLFDRQVKKTPDQLAVIFGNDQITFKELDEKSNQLAHYLRNKGVGEDTLVPFCVNRSLKMVIGLLGILKAGGAYVPVDPKYPKERIHYMLENTGGKIIVCNNFSETELFDGKDRTIVDLEFDWKYICDEIKTSVQTRPSADHLAYMIYTSGSTGQPKGVMIEHGSLVNFMHGINAVLPLKNHDHLLAITSISFDISILELFWTLCNGILITIKKSDKSLSGFDRYIKDHTSSMDFSLFYFSSQGENLGNKYKLLLESVSYADKNDFSAVWLPERHFHEFGGVFPNPAVLGAGLATVTEKVEIRSGSIVLPLHDVIRVAEEWSVVDNLSNGRTSLSIASGWHADDFVLMPENYAARQEIMYGQIKELNALWRGESVKRINGQNKEISVKTFPRPVRSNLPIWITSAGNTETFRSAGTIGANILTHLLGQEINDLEKNIKIYKQALKENGFPEQEAKIAIMLHTYIGKDLEQVKSEVKEPFKSYLKSSAGLIKNFAASLNIQLDGGYEKDLDYLFELAFERYWQSSALLGTVESCKNLIEKLSSIGVTEIACLIDFGVENEKVLEGLKYLNDLRKEYAILNTKQPASRPISSIQITPSYLTALVNDENSRHFLKSLKHLIIGGEKLPDELLEKLYNVTDASIYNMYGPTETTIWSASKKWTHGSKNTIGRPLMNTCIYILDKQKNLCPIGVNGEIFIGGKGLSRGYFKQQKLTEESFIRNPFSLDKKHRIYRTGDFGRWTNDGNIEIAGRLDNQVKIRGYRIEKGEIEYVIKEFKGVSNCVVNVCEIEGEKSLAAYITGAINDISELRSFLEKKLPEYLIPSYFVLLDEMPLTPNGKIDRKSLPDPIIASLLSDEKKVLARNETEKKLTDFWSTILKLPVTEIGIDTNFFTIGGNSLRAVSLLSVINKEFAIAITLTDIFVNSSIRNLADLISRVSGNVEYTPIPLAKKAEYYDLSHNQKRIWIMNQVQEDPSVLNVIQVFLFEGALDKASLEKTIQALIARHEILRTTFTVVDGKPVQRVHDSLPSTVEYIEDLDGETAIEKFIKREEKIVFDLTKGPLLRVTLINYEKDKYVFILNMHHIISDGWSTNILKNEIISLYNSFASGIVQSLPPLTVHYKDYAAWSNAELNSSKTNASKIYWAEKLSGNYGVLNFPSDFPRPQIRTNNGAVYSFSIDVSQVKTLDSIAIKNDATLFMLFSAVVKTLLHKYSGEQDIVIGTLMAGRDHKDLEHQIGFYVNNLVLRTEIDAQGSFNDVLERVKETVLEAFNHGAYPFDKLIGELALKRDRSRNPLFDIIVRWNVFEEINEFTDPSEIELEGLVIKRKGLERNVSEFDLEFDFFPVTGGLGINITYNRDVYSYARIEKLAIHFKNLVAAISDGSKWRIPLPALNIMEASDVNVKKSIEFNFKF